MVRLLLTLVLLPRVLLLLRVGLMLIGHALLILLMLLAVRLLLAVIVLAHVLLLLRIGLTRVNGTLFALQILLTVHLALLLLQVCLAVVERLLLLVLL